MAIETVGDWIKSNPRWVDDVLDFICDQATSAQSICKNESPIEREYMLELLELGIVGFRSQYRVGCYRIDIAFPKEKVAVELDGRAFHSSPEAIKHDAKKDEYLKGQGWTVLRLTGSQVWNNIELCIAKTKLALGRPLGYRSKCALGLINPNDNEEELSMEK